MGGGGSGCTPLSARTEHPARWGGAAGAPDERVGAVACSVSIWYTYFGGVNGGVNTILFANVKLWLAPDGMCEGG